MRLVLRQTTDGLFEVYETFSMETALYTKEQLLQDRHIRGVSDDEITVYGSLLNYIELQDVERELYGGEEPQFTYSFRDDGIGKPCAFMHGGVQSIYQDMLRILQHTNGVFYVPDFIQSFPNRHNPVLPLLQNMTVIRRFLADGVHCYLPDAFFECNQYLEDVQCTVIALPNRLCRHCHSLRSVSIEFVGVPKQTEYLYMTESFKDCTSLSEVDLRGHLPTIGLGMFRECRSLKHIVLPGITSAIRKMAFAESGLESIDLTNVHEVNELAFWDCKALRHVEFGGDKASIRLIDDRSFTGCTALQSVTLPPTVTSLGVKAFAEDTELILHKDSAVYQRFKNKTHEDCDRYRITVV